MDVTNSHQPEVMEFFVLFYSPVFLSLFSFFLCAVLLTIAIYYLSKLERLFSLRRICIDPWRGGGEGINTPNWYISSFFTPHCSFLILYVRVRKTYIVVTSMLNAL